MKNLIIYALLFLNFNASAQFTEDLINKEFPVLELPFDNRGMLFRINAKSGILNPKEVPFVKGEITSIIHKYKDGVLIVNEQAKQYAIGKINFANRNYIVYLEAAVHPDYKVGTNELYIVSLDDHYQPIQAQSISYYLQTFSGNQSNTDQIIETTHQFGIVKGVDGKLRLSLTNIFQKDKMPQDIHIEKTTDHYEYEMDEEGRLIEIKKND